MNCQYQLMLKITILPLLFNPAMPPQRRVSLTAFVFGFLCVFYEVFVLSAENNATFISVFSSSSHGKYGRFPTIFCRKKLERGS